MNTTTFKIDGMHCDGCAKRVQTILTKEPGIREARVSFAEGSAEVRYDPHTVGVQRLHEIIEKGGFHVLERTA